MEQRPPGGSTRRDLPGTRRAPESGLMARKLAKVAKANTPREGPRPPAADSVDGAPHIPKWLPPALFVVLTLVLFREFVFTDRMLFGGDTLGLGYVARAFYASALTELGTFPRWAP